MPSPKAMKVLENPKGLLIDWDDQHQSTYPFSFLRKACPCAVCKGERTPLDTSPLALPVLKDMPPSAFEAEELFKVGRYAVGFRWKDGHDTGIYTFDYLRACCPCETCQNPGH